MSKSVAKANVTWLKSDDLNKSFSLIEALVSNFVVHIKTKN